MEITQRVEGDVTVFLPDGRIDTLAADEMDQALQAAVAGGSHKIVVDMSKSITSAVPGCVLSPPC